MKSANVSPELAAKAYEIADSWSMCDIESNTAAIKSLGWRWWDSSSADDDGVDKSLAYLDARGLVIRHPEHPHWVRFTIHEKPSDD